MGRKEAEKVRVMNDDNSGRMGGWEGEKVKRLVW